MIDSTNIMFNQDILSFRRRQGKLINIPKVHHESALCKMPSIVALGRDDPLSD
jgi:hypothetical protein